MKPDKIIDCWNLVTAIAENQIFVAGQNEDEIRRILLISIGEYLQLDYPLDTVDKMENLPEVITPIPKKVLDALETWSLTPDELIEFSITYLKTVPFSELKNYIAIEIE